MVAIHFLLLEVKIMGKKLIVGRMRVVFPYFIICKYGNSIHMHIDKECSKTSKSGIY